MGKVLFLLFTVVPVVEIALLVQLGSWVGTWPTIGLVVVTGLVGAALAKHEGLRVLRDWQTAMAQGRLPAEGVLSGLLVLVGGVLLVTPGVMTDVLGFSLLLPPTRKVIAGVVRRWAERAILDGRMVASVATVSHAASAHAHPAAGRVPVGPTIDVEVE